MAANSHRNPENLIWGLPDIIHSEELVLIEQMNVKFRQYLKLSIIKLDQISIGLLRRSENTTEDTCLTQLWIQGDKGHVPPVL